LPDDFYVIHDVATAHGNLDHVVVGPTGVFIVDAKNWRGIVTSDGRRELLLNGRRTDKPQVGPVVNRMLNVRDKVRVLAGGVDPYYDVVLVFTSAWVDAPWGSTGAARCIRDDQLFDYVVATNRRKLLNADEVRQLAQAFLGLAHVDQDFSRVPERQPVLAAAAH
jgi:hypothetical protein